MFFKICVSVLKHCIRLRDWGMMYEVYFANICADKISALVFEVGRAGVSLQTPPFLNCHSRVWKIAMIKFKYCHSPTQPQHELVLDPPHPGTFKALPGNLGSWFSVCNLILTQLERWPQKKMEDYLKKQKKWKTTSKKMKKNGRRPIFFLKN